jgi:integrase
VVINALNFAVQRGYATENAAKETAKARAKDAPVGILTVEQTARLLETAEGDMLAYCAIGAFAGLRRSEIVQLDWSEIDFESDLIEVSAQKSKTAQRRHVTLQPNLRQWLLPLRKHSGPVVAVNYGRRLVATRRRAGLTDWPQNALRHSFGSCHLAHFKNAALTALEMGHTDARVTFRHYRELVKPRDAERYWNIRPSTAEKVVPMVAR